MVPTVNSVEYARGPTANPLAPPSPRGDAVERVVTSVNCVVRLATGVGRISTILTRPGLVVKDVMCTSDVGHSLPVPIATHGTILTTSLRTPIVRVAAIVRPDGLLS